MWSLVALSAAGALAVGCAAEAEPIQEPAAPAGVRLYVFDCGLLKRGEPTGYDLTTEQVGGVTDFFNGCYFVVHPRGTLLWDTGIVPDALIAEGTESVGTEIPGNNWAFRSLRGQLAALGYGPEGVTYLAMSHSHGDHVANANSYAASTWLVQEDEWNSMFGPEATGSGGRSRAFNNYSALRESKTIKLDGDHDVFGDGAVVIKSTPGHSPGHQSLFIALSNTGPVLLSGDLYHYAAERTLNKIPRMDVREQTAKSRADIETFLHDTGATLWIQHDLTLSKTLKFAPEYYD